MGKLSLRALGLRKTVGVVVIRLPQRELKASINPLNAELNPVCHLLALLGAHHILYISRIRVKEVSE
jgi:hypothetical protein